MFGSLPRSRLSACFSHQGGHGEAYDLDAAVVMALRLEISVIAGVSPGHGASTVPTPNREDHLIFNTVF